MEFRDILNYFFKNGSVQAPANFKILKPDILVNNLQHKQIRVQKFYINNTSLPIFIPNRITDPSYFNVVTTAAHTQYVNNTLTSQSLQYYIILRDSTSTNATVVFLQQPNLNFGVPMPPTVIYDDYQYYINPYYYYYDFTHFLTVIVNAINQAYSVNPSAAGDPPSPILWQNKDGYFQLFIQNDTSWYIELSQSLINILPFKNIQVLPGIFRLIFDPTPVTINGANYNEVDANFYDTIFPFAQLVFQSDDSELNPIIFVDQGALTSNTQVGRFESSILTFDIETNNFLGVYNFYKYVNNEDSLWINFHTDKNSKNHLTVTLYLRLKNGLLIPYLLNPDELCTFSVEIKYTA